MNIALKKKLMISEVLVYMYKTRDFIFNYADSIIDPCTYTNNIPSESGWNYFMKKPIIYCRGSIFVNCKCKVAYE